MRKATREFQVFVKPISAVCNLDCRYCYYLEKRQLYPQAGSLRMPDDLLEDYIVQHMNACPIPTINFSWHGGEPTVLGLDYFRRIVEIQRRHRPPGCEVINGIQTNGTLLDDDWCRFLAAEGFYVGLSLDGPAEFHDVCRIGNSGQPTHARALEGYRRLRRHGVHCDVLCVVHRHNVHHPRAVYRFFKDIDARYLMFLPLVRRTPDGGVSAETVPAAAYGEFLCSVFDEWIRQDIARIYVQMFDEAAKPLCGLEHSLCVHRETCGELPVLEHNGDLYSCDHYVDRDHFLGNLREKTIVEALESRAQQAFGRNKRDSLPRSCRRCKVRAFCNGGCPKDRFVTSPDGDPGMNYLCAGYYRFFSHARPTLRRLASFLRTGQPVGQFADRLRAEEAQAAAPAGRNDPCPCGSGLKYKKCCLGKAPSGPPGTVRAQS